MSAESISGFISTSSTNAKRFAPTTSIMYAFRITGPSVRIVSRNGTYIGVVGVTSATSASLAAISEFIATVTPSGCNSLMDTLDWIVTALNPFANTYRPTRFVLAGFVEPLVNATGTETS